MTKFVLRSVGFFFLWAFFLEMVLKLFGLGFRQYWKRYFPSFALLLLSFPQPLE